MSDARFLWLERLAADFQYAIRSLRQSSGFAITAITSLALGIGANSAIFGLIDAVRLRSLPVPSPQELAQVRVQGNGSVGLIEREDSLSYPQLLEIRKHQQVFSSMLAWTDASWPIGDGEKQRRAFQVLASGDLFPTLQVAPAAGRLLDPADDHPNCADPPVVLSYALWQNEFGGSASAIGKRITVARHSLEIVGVAPATFTGLDIGRRFDMALPLCAYGSLHNLGQYTTRTDVFWLSILGRLKPGITLAQASSQLTAMSPGIMEATLPTGYADDTVTRYRAFRLEAVPGSAGVSILRAAYDAPLWILLAITGLVLLIACANLANLMLARGAARERELAVRVALGAPRLRLVRQVLCESLILAIAGAAIAVALSKTLSAGVVGFLSSTDHPLFLDLSVDWRVLGFTALVASALCIFMGFAPAWRATQTDPGEAVRSGGRGMTANAARFRFQRFLVIGQIAVSVVLVTAALLFVQSFRKLVTMDPGFRSKGILLVYWQTPRPLSSKEGRALERQLLDEARSIPQVEMAASTTNVVVGAGRIYLGVQVGVARQYSVFTWVSPGSFQALETPLLAGRDFNEHDTDSSPKVAVVNQSFVKLFFPEGSPIGKTFRSVAEPDFPEAQFEIVGVVKDTRYYDMHDAQQPMVYAPSTQVTTDAADSMYVRSLAPLSSLAGSLKERIAELHPEIEMSTIEFQTQIDRGFARDRLLAMLSGFFGVLAALLASIGLYGVISYMVVRRQNEIGIRMALGSGRARVIGLVMADVGVMLAAGIVIGLGFGLAATRTAQSLLFEISPRDPAIFVTAIVVLGLVALASALLPARRAARMDPMVALRCD